MAIIMYGLGAALVAMIVGIGLVFSKDVRVLIDYDPTNGLPRG